ncbi:MULTISPECIES: sugar nucleotide-binding protein [unclassified Streptomyces]|uniref:SDR family oxidoreductase n=1 Tax=unclassified Streptomyces TaxID=2593676 RepID=UPI000DBA41DF|nr:MULTISPECIES: sugar nucleotide-binding protein [unclassified Streptomyces]MYT68307.1 sugar nucleotide-binding protein [Streptomyces sp. SID8367]RAJ76942.1 dTDP-4-dehydrorhamnose reductase [Streptomyces sp. PsTaAH-137]
MTTLIIGGSGFLGSELVRQATETGHNTAATCTTAFEGRSQTAVWHQLDLRQPEDLERVLDAVDPDLVVNVASSKASWTVTAQAPIRIALAAAQRGFRLVHVSSDAIFSGARVHYCESDQPDPASPYGAMKAAAETGVLAVAPEAVVARTSLIIGRGQSIHERVVHEMAAGTREGALFTDDIRCPVFVEDLAAALLELAAGETTGIRHLAGTDAISRHELGTLIAGRDGLDASRLRPALRPHTPLSGALDVRLDSRATQQMLHTKLRGAREFCTATVSGAVTDCS